MQPLGGKELVCGCVESHEKRKPTYVVANGTHTPAATIQRPHLGNGDGWTNFEPETCANNGAEDGTRTDRCPSAASSTIIGPSESGSSSPSPATSPVSRRSPECGHLPSLSRLPLPTDDMDWETSIVARHHAADGPPTNATSDASCHPRPSPRLETYGVDHKAGIDMRSWNRHVRRRHSRRSHYKHHSG